MKFKNLLILLPIITSLVNLEMASGKPSTKPTNKPTLNITVKGNCGKYKCQTLFTQLTHLYPKYMQKYQEQCLLDKSNKQNKIIGLGTYKDDQSQKVYFTCWDAKKEKDGNRYGTYLGALPTLGQENRFLTPLPTDPPYAEYLQQKYGTQVKKAQFECSTKGGNFNFLRSEDEEFIQLQCYYQGGVNFQDTNNDWVFDGETRGAGVDEILGSFPIPTANK